MTKSKDDGGQAFPLPYSAYHSEAASKFRASVQSLIVDAIREAGLIFRRAALPSNGWTTRL